MPLRNQSQAIAAQVPLLRRYARALSGSQVSGDAWVRQALEALVADHESLDGALPPKIALYRLFQQVWRSGNPATDTAEPVTGGEQVAQARLSRLVPERRQALLLTTLEGFTADEAAIILNRNPDEVRTLVDAALADLGREIATEVLIIEDEPAIALDLADIVGELGHAVNGIVVTRSEAVAVARERRPGLILADIQLADDSSGIEAVKDILSDGSLPFVFITAYPERLLTGDRPEPAFLITKPFLPDAVKAAISQALFFYPPTERAA